MKRHETIVLLVAAVVALAGVPALGSAGSTTDAKSSTWVTTQVQQDNQTVDAVRIENETVTVAGVTVTIENSLASVERGTPTLWFKRITVSDEHRNETWTLRNGMLALSNSVTFADHVRTDVRTANQQELATEAFLRHLVRDASGVGVRAWIGSVEIVSPNQRQTMNNVQFVRSVGGVPEEPRAERPSHADRSAFTVSKLDAPSNVSSGDTYNVTATVTNPGNVNGTEEVQYRVNDRVLGRQLVQLGPGESTTVTFQVNAGQLPISNGTGTQGVFAFEDHQVTQLTVDNNASDGGGQSRIAKIVE